MTGAPGNPVPHYFFTADAEADAEADADAEAEAENTETRGNIQNIPFSHKKYMLLAKYHTKKLFTTETKTNGYHTLHYHHSNFTTILPSVSLFLPFSVTEIRFRDPKGKSMP